MFGSLKLGKFFGIDLFVHGTFWLLPLFVLFNGAFSGDVAGAAFDVMILFAIFGCVVLHEVGHALAARYYGIGTRDITLYPVGGVASLERIPERPWQEIAIALAGPAVNLVIAAGLLVGIVATNVAIPGSFSLAGMDPLDVFVFQVLIANLFLLVFNLIPAFPMDGGRVLRALLSMGMPRVDATRVAVTVGAVIAAGFFLVGVGALPNPLTDERGMSFGLILVAGVVFLLGQAELAGVRAQAAQRQWRDQYADEDDGPGVAQRGVPFNGWKWDPVRRVWSQWRDGVVVREVPMA
jgi:Zn-dependent protease